MLNYEFPPLGGGGGRAAYLLARAFIQKGYQVDYLTSRYKNWPDFEVVNGINIYRVKAWGRQKQEAANFISMASYIIFALALGFKLCRQNRYNFINTHFALPTGPLGVILSKIFKIKNILSIHGGDIYDPSKRLSPHRCFFWRKIISWVLNNSSEVVAQSKNTRDNARKYYNIQKEIKVIPLPYKPFIFQPKKRRELGLLNSKKYLISIGRLIPRKGFKYLIQALTFLDKDIELIIIGEGEEKNNLLNLAHKLGVDKRVIFLGNASEEEKFQYLACTDIYVLSSLHEGFAIVLQEAMQVGLPIVATNNGGQIDFLTQENALLVTPANPGALVRAIKKILSRPDLQEKFSRNNREKIKQFAPSNVIDRYLKLVI